MDQPKRTTNSLSDRQVALAESAWDEIGKSIAMMVVHGERSKAWAWELLKPLGIYKKWMLDYWIEKCKNLNLDPDKETKPRRLGKKPVLIKKADRSVFKSKDQIKEALLLLKQGHDPKSIIDAYNTDNGDIVQ